LFVLTQTHAALLVFIFLVFAFFQVWPFLVLKLELWKLLQNIFLDRLGVVSQVEIIQ